MAGRKLLSLEPVLTIQFWCNVQIVASGIKYAESVSDSS